MDKDIDRWRNSLKEFKKISIDNLVVRFPGIEYIENGHYWCMKSHEKIIKIAKQKKYEKVVIFEDDISIKNNKKTKDHLRDLLKEQSYDIWYLWWLFLHPKIKLTKFKDKYFKVEYLYGWHAIIYNKNIYKKFLEIIKKNDKKVLNKKTTFDELLAKIIQKENCCIIPEDWLIEQKMGFSNTEFKNKWRIFGFINKIGYFTSRKRYLYPLQYLLLSLANILIKKTTL